ncbi:MAG: hypothetical protein D6780_07330, partial [Candidatus Dadabacteria bacterium]
YKIKFAEKIVVIKRANINRIGIGKQMVLKRVLNGPPNFHRLNLSPPKQRIEYDPVGLYRRLVASPLYDKINRQWNWSMRNDQELKDSNSYATAQLLGALVLAQFDKEAAEEVYERLKETPLYDKERGQWNWRITESRELKWSDRLAFAQLLGVLVLAQFDKEAAKKAYRKLQMSCLYDIKRGQWKWSMREDQMLKDSTRYAGDQLLGVLVLAQFDKEAAKTAYEKLKETRLYDEERGQWNTKIDEDQVPTDLSRHAGDQLLGVLVLAQFDKEAARTAYEKLKLTPLYDEKRRVWNEFMTEGQTSASSERRATDQLLAVLVEFTLQEKEEVVGFANDELPLPEVFEPLEVKRTGS